MSDRLTLSRRREPHIPSDVRDSDALFAQRFKDLKSIVDNVDQRDLQKKRLFVKEVNGKLHFDIASKPFLRINRKQGAEKLERELSKFFGTGASHLRHQKMGLSEFLKNKALYFEFRVGLQAFEDGIGNYKASFRAINYKKHDKSILSEIKRNVEMLDGLFNQLEDLKTDIGQRLSPRTIGATDLIPEEEDTETDSKFSKIDVHTTTPEQTQPTQKTPEDKGSAFRARPQSASRINRPQSVYHRAPRTQSDLNRHSASISTRNALRRNVNPVGMTTSIFEKSELNVPDNGIHRFQNAAPGDCLYESPVDSSFQNFIQDDRPVDFLLGMRRDEYPNREFPSSPTHAYRQTISNDELLKKLIEDAEADVSSNGAMTRKAQIAPRPASKPQQMQLDHVVPTTAQVTQLDRRFDYVPVKRKIVRSSELNYAQGKGLSRKPANPRG